MFINSCVIMNMHWKNSTVKGLCTCVRHAVRILQTFSEGKLCFYHSHLYMCSFTAISGCSYLFFSNILN